jgi:hypothetical protein
MIERSKATLEMLKCLVFFLLSFRLCRQDRIEDSGQAEVGGGGGEVPWVVVWAKGVASRQPA